MKTIYSMFLQCYLRSALQILMDFSDFCCVCNATETMNILKHMLVTSTISCGSSNE